MEEQATNSALIGLMAGLGMGIMLFAFAIGIFAIVCHWKVYSKAGEPGWACIIPIYNLIIFLKIVNKPWWYLFMFLIPIYGWFILPIICIHRLSLSFGKNAWFTLGLLFFNVIFFAILAFDNSTYTKLAD